MVALTLSVAGCGLSRDLEPPSSAAFSRLAVDEAAARRLISDYRLSHGATALVLDPMLVRVAQRQADAMARANALTHTLFGALPDRLAAEGARGGAMAENVYAGYPSLERALAGWQRSPPHNANLLYPPLRRMGIAAAAAPGTRYGTFWSLVMTD